MDAVDGLPVDLQDGQDLVALVLGEVGFYQLEILLHELTLVPFLFLLLQ